MNPETRMISQIQLMMQRKPTGVLNAHGEE